MTGVPACAGYDLNSGTKCTRQPTVTVTAGSVHEHVGPRELCSWHDTDVRTGNMICGTCAEVDGHWCVLRVLAATLYRGDP